MAAKRRVRPASSIRGMFWNLGGRDRRALVAQAAHTTDCDIVALSESGCDVDENLAALRQAVNVNYVCPPFTTPRLQVFARTADLDLAEAYGTANGRLTIRTLRSRGQEFLFVAAHLVSKLR